mmetsp:Transcript_40670/g.73264  ORF Transcript_40670/g.73264 Transcript_40670/m.73264 type:complete len:445 (+) Transcript_40670:1617-2951(+)
MPRHAKVLGLLRWIHGLLVFHFVLPGRTDPLQSSHHGMEGFIAAPALLGSLHLVPACLQLLNCRISPASSSIWVIDLFAARQPLHYKHTKGRYTSRHLKILRLAWPKNLCILDVANVRREEPLQWPALSHKGITEGLNDQPRRSCVGHLHTWSTGARVPGGISFHVPWHLMLHTDCASSSVHKRNPEPAKAVFQRPLCDVDILSRLFVRILFPSFLGFWRLLLFFRFNPLSFALLSRGGFSLSCSSCFCLRLLFLQSLLLQGIRLLLPDLIPNHAEVHAILHDFHCSQLPSRSRHVFQEPWINLFLLRVRLCLFFFRRWSRALLFWILHRWRRHVNHLPISSQVRYGVDNTTLKCCAQDHGAIRWDHHFLHRLAVTNLSRIDVHHLRRSHGQFWLRRFTLVYGRDARCLAVRPRGWILLGGGPGSGRGGSSSTESLRRSFTGLA